MILLFEPVWFVIQIHEEAKKFAYQSGLRVVVAYGGAPITNQVDINAAHSSVREIG